MTKTGLGKLRRRSWNGDGIPYSVHCSWCRSRYELLHDSPKHRYSQDEYFRHLAEVHHKKVIWVDERIRIPENEDMSSKTSLYSGVTTSGQMKRTPSTKNATQQVESDTYHSSHQARLELRKKNGE